MTNFEGAKTKEMNEPGRLLWVCRRNGTWWPSQILSLDQVPESYMSLRRSGTPVKLLGKENAIIEWYNIKTSKRIKAFRCGEFNECIENVKASANDLSKMPTKYARREDAILHALKLEGAQKLEDKTQHEIGGLSSPLVPNDVDHKMGISSELRGNSNFGHELTHYGASSEDTSFEKKISRKRKMNSPDDLEDIKKFGGVEELGVRLAFKKDSKVEVKSLDHQHYTDSGPATSSDDIDVMFITNVETGSESRDVDAELVTTQRLLPHPASCPFSESLDGIYDQLNLVDVKVEVEMSYKPQNVPFISIESGLNGHSIIGHPIDIEVLDDISKDNFLNEVFNVEKISSSTRLSSLIPFEEKRFQKVIPEVKDLENTFTHCVPVSRIFSRLKASL